jgi:hypothetical protein
MTPSTEVCAERGVPAPEGLAHPFATCPAAAPADIEMGALLRFKSHMALQGQPVQVARMCFDRLYAYERIASAHATGADPLQRMALELFQAYHRRDEMRQALAA